MKVKELLINRWKWTQKAAARDERGKVVLTFSDDAVCWCLLGAVERCYLPIQESKNDLIFCKNYNKFEEIESIIFQTIKKLYPKKRYKGVIGFNDSRKTTFEMIEKVLEEANV